MRRAETLRSRYVPTRVLGRGSFGTTYLARDARSGEGVALKVLEIARLEDWKAFEHFQAEAKLLGRLQHPCIPRFIEAFEAGSGKAKRLCIVQELAPGSTLQALSEAGWRASEREARDIASRLLRVLSYVHRQGLVHRDIKPSNVLRDGAGRLRLVDFGGARHLGGTRRGSTLVGTFGYMAPEQLRGQSLPASDLHALGATIVFALTGGSPAELPQRRLRPELGAHRQIPRAMRPWLQRMLSPTVEDRFRDADEALRALLRPRAVRVPRALPWALAAGVGVCALFAAAARAEGPTIPADAPRTLAPRAPLLLARADERVAPPPPPIVPSPPSLSMPTAVFVPAPPAHALGYTSSLRPLDRFEDERRGDAEPLYLQLSNAEVEAVVDGVWKGDAEERGWLLARIARPLAIRHGSREQIRAALVGYLRSVGARRVRAP